MDIYWGHSLAAISTVVYDVEITDRLDILNLNRNYY